MILLCHFPMYIEQETASPSHVVLQWTRNIPSDVSHVIMMDLNII